MDHGMIKMLTRREEPVQLGEMREILIAIGNFEGRPRLMATLFRRGGQFDSQEFPDVEGGHHHGTPLHAT